MNKFIKQIGAFTIIETLLGLTLLVIISFGIINIFNLYNKLGQTIPDITLSSLIQRSHLETIGNFKIYVRQAQNILATTTVDGILYTTATTTLILKLRSIDSLNQIVPDSYDLVIFYTNTTTPPITLYRKISASPQSKRQSGVLILNKMVQNLSFAYDTPDPKDAKLVNINLETSKGFGTKQINKSSIISISLR